MSLRTLAFLCFVCCAAAMVGGCGQKGALYMPDDVEAGDPQNSKDVEESDV